MLEKEVEAYLVKQVKKAGGECLKWVSPGNAGVPDRICMFPSGHVVFVEVKSPTGSLRPLQLRWADRLGSLDVDWRCVKNKQEVDDLVLTFTLNNAKIDS